MSRVIAVDFDGTLCRSMYPQIGEENKPLIDRLIRAQKDGDELVLWTCRSGELLKAAVDWCEERGLTFDKVNENTESRMEKFGEDPRKVSADIYIDDRSIRWDIGEEDQGKLDEKRGKNMDNRETRMMSFDVRAEQNEEHGHFLTGRPIVFNQRTNLGWHDEIIDAGALDQADLKDVRFLVGHNTQMIPLARSRNNNENSTMQLLLGPVAMDIRVDLDTENNMESRALYSAADRGDITGMSFMFTIDADSWDDLESDHPTRHIRKIGKVFEVSAVAFPAYEQTTLEARAEGTAPDGARASLESARQKLAEERKAQEAAERREALLKILRGEQ